MRNKIRYALLHAYLFIQRYSLTLAWVIFFLIFLMMASCRTTTNAIDNNTNVKERTVTIYKDSLIIKDSLIYVQVPTESEHNYIFGTDTLYLSTSTTTAKAWVNYKDSVLQGTISNKPNATIPTTIHPTEHYINHTDTIYRDSIQTQVKTETIVKKTYPSTYGYLLAFFLLSLIYYGYRAYSYLKIKLSK